MSEAETLSVAVADVDETGALLAATAQGDNVAFERLYRQTSSRLFGVCLRIVNHRGDAEDVLQEVYATVWRKAAQFDGSRASGVTWLTMMARNKSIDRLRSTSQARRALPIETAEDVREPGPNAQEAAESMLENRRLDGCLAELEPQRSDLIRVAFFEGVTYEELAERTGNPLGTVKSWIRRSLVRLKACLER